MNILFLTSEAVPFAKTGGLGDVSGVLPKALAGSENVSLVLPDYMTGGINQLQPVPTDDFSVWMGTKSFPVTIKSAVISNNFSVFFVFNEHFFGREFLYGDQSGDYSDNFVRFFVFQKAVLEFVRRQGLHYDIIHCNDWQSAMIPLFVRVGALSASFKRTKTVFAIHNLGYQGIFPASFFWESGLPPFLFSPDYLEFYGNLNCMKAGIIFSERIVTVSPTYSREIVTADHGFGLDGLLRKYSFKLSGILNGADYSQWDPRVDPYIVHHFSGHSLDGKRRNKQELFARLGISQSSKVPLMAMISRISEQKGMKLLLELLPDLLNEDLHFIFLGIGDRHWTEKLLGMASRFPERMTFLNRFDERMAHRLEAAADILFMPSVYEPCGLNQIYAMRYGTVPLVRATGGLEDSVQEFDPDAGQGTGFKFKGDDPIEVMSVVRRALRFFSNRDLWRTIQRNAMEKDFSWSRTVSEYLDLYNNTLAEDTKHG